MLKSPYFRHLVYKLFLLSILITSCASPNNSTIIITQSQATTLVANTPSPTLLPTNTPIIEQEPTFPVIQLREALSLNDCQLPTVVAPTAAPTPRGYAGIDQTTGLHITGNASTIELESYRIFVNGLVDNPLELTYDEIRCLPKVEVTCPLVCPGVFVDHATWAGTPIESVLDLAGIQDGAQSLRLVSVDGYYTVVDLETVRASQAFLAYELEGKTLPVLHGFPIRAVLPGVDGNRWVKWLARIEVQ